MELPRRPLSRRTLLKASAIAPVVAACRTAWAQPTEENVGQLVLLTREIPDAELDALKGLAANEGADATMFELVVRTMWAHFTFGLAKTKIGAGEKILENSWNLSGAPVCNNVKLGNFDPVGSHYQTNVCCYLCGHKAALASGGNDLTFAVYEAAWNETKDEMQKKLALARSLPQGSGDPTLYQGNGC